ncbi:hypothetical protein [Thalassotalea montiporae]
MLQISKLHWLFSLILVGAYAFYDINDREFAQAESITQKVIKQSSLDGRLLSKEAIVLDEILNLYKGFDKPAVEAPKPAPIVQTKPIYSGLSDEERNAQQGRLDKLYTKDFKYTVLGLFQEQHQWFAILIQEHLTTGAFKEVKVDVGKQLGSYNVNNINKTSVELASAVTNNKITLSIF